jgi:predicted MFS family arabinose efflux permease
VSGAYRMINYGVRPVGALLGGFLGSSLGLRNALWISAIGAICAAFLRISPHVFKLRSFTLSGEVSG